MLVLAPRHKVSRDRLAATLWPDRLPEQSRASLRQELSSLRKALKGGGPLLMADATTVELSPDAVASGFGAPTDGDFLEGLDIRSEPFDDWRRQAGAELRNTPTAPLDDTRTEPEDFFSNPSVLVAAFTPASSADDDTAFATGLTVDLRTALAMWRWFPVIGPEAVGWKNDQTGDLRALATSVSASYAIAGLVRRVGERIRVTASLTDVETGHLIWSDSFDGHMEDLFDMQEAISRAVVARVAPEIGHAEASRVVRKAPGNMGAWQLLAQVDELNRNGGEGYGTPESNHAMVPLIEEAISLEPDNARAWSLRARYNFRSGMQGWTEDRDGALQRSLEYSEKAIQLAATDWEAQAYRALALVFVAQDFEPGRYHAYEAVRLNPSAPAARHAIGCALEWMGDTKTALRHLYRVFDLDPNFSNRSAVLGDITTCELFEGNIDKAAEAARKIRSIAPNYCRGLQRVAVTLAHAGDLDGAKEALARVYDIQPDFDAPYVRSTYPFANPDHIDIFIEGLERAGWSG